MKRQQRVCRLQEADSNKGKRLLLRSGYAVKTGIESASNCTALYSRFLFKITLNFAL